MPTPQPPVDPSVKIPASVVAANARADAIHAQVYANPNPGDQPPAPQPAPAADAPPVPPAPQPAPPPAQSAEPPAPQPQPPQSGDMYPDKTANLTPEQWKHQYLSMKGRYEQASQSIGSLQEQMGELGDELLRTQQTIRQPQRANPPQPQQVQALVTDEEIKTYGPELIDVITRAARQAVMPDMQNLHTGVQQVSQRVQQVSTGGLYADLDRSVADWRTINVSPRFKAWCGLRDVYSGQVRGKLLNAAFQAADAPRVVAFFQGFLNEEQATGQLPDPSVPPQTPQSAVRQPAIPLESLTAPGRAHPAGGDQPLPNDKPIFTRQQIAAFYREVREGRYVGREQDKSTTENAIFSAQREGRVR